MNTYLLMILLSIVIGHIAVVTGLKHKNVPNNIIIYSVMLSTICVIYFGKLYTVLTALDKNITIINSGFSSIGGALGIILSTSIICRICQQYKKEITECYVLIIPLMYSISKIGCHIAGCCYGIPYNGIGSVTSKIHNETQELFPIQMLEVIVFMLIFVISSLILMNKKCKNFITYEIIVCAMVKFGLDYLRYSHIEKIISFNQIMCLVISITSIVVALCKKEKIENEDYYL